MSDLTAPLIRPDTALQSLRDAGYSLTDAIGEIVDNSIQGSARSVRIDWTLEEVPRGPRSNRMKTEVRSLAIADDGTGIPKDILAQTLTLGFSTRYNDRAGIGRYGVGYKLGTISQCQRLEVYTRPAFLRAEWDEATESWVPRDPNTEGRVFFSYLDLEEIADPDPETRQTTYEVREDVPIPEEYASLMVDEDGQPSTGTLVVWKKLDKVNEQGAFSETVNERLRPLEYFLRRTYRYYIDGGLEIYVPGREGPLPPYDPAFLLYNPEAEELAPETPMTGDVVEAGEFEIDGEPVRWRVTLTPEVTRLKRGGGGVEGPDGARQFAPLHIPDNQGKLSFLRQEREISYTIVPKMLPSDKFDPSRNLDRFIAIEVWFPAALDEYFQVRHVKRGVEPVDKLRRSLRQTLEKPVKTARERIRRVWAQTRPRPEAVEVTLNRRQAAESAVNSVATRLTSGRAGLNVTPEESREKLDAVAREIGIHGADARAEFVSRAEKQRIVSFDTEWRGKGMLEIEHLNRTVVVALNRRHPFIRHTYLPLRDALDKGVDQLQPFQVQGLLENAANGIDLLFFAYAEAENMSPTPDEDYEELREDWGKFASVFLHDMKRVEIG